ncbi:phospholipase D-like domain-containing protein [Aliiroseovarius sp. KMU-50]|uniref:Phospholipase D n=1 Tax=Aliiroseovarius salicola TaxID=3009082 RepID=A0ABT4W0J2_9RHOB|nr:phospholipase D-like domain-containing protein [Aliiroseovarius sp. KMU-50]MDA5094035.1 phospholipase D-like domain-containing protein [Aliiroseovarius sp. KMU-50]
MPVIAGDLSFFMGPQQLGAPDDLLQPILDFIDSARSRQNLMIAIQEVDHPDIANAIIRARLRGVVVDLVLEQSYLLAQRRPASLDDAHEAKGKHEVNRKLFNAILRSTADVKVDFNPSIFHQKFMVLGNRVLTGSTNFTETGVTRNLNHLVVVDDAEVANAFKAEFREIRVGNFGKASVAHGPAPKEARVSGMRIKPLFAPDHAPEMEIMKQILKAKSRIDFAVFTFSKSSGIDDALIAAHRSGISVNGVLDKRQANQKWAAKHTLSDAGVSLSMAQGGAGFGKLHHKLMVIDDDVTVIGSFNYTGPANKSNDENIMVIGDGDETDPAAIALQRSVNAAARAEIDRIISTFGE